MRTYTILAATAAITTAVASPVLVKKDDYAAPPGGDIDILNYALTLEFLERRFYQEGLATYSEQDFCDAGFTSSFYQNLKEIYFDEQSHVDFLATALGGQAVKEATYSFPYTDPKSFVALSAVLEGVGVSAYIGAAGAIANKAYLTAAGTILGVEARHAAYVRDALGEAPFPKPYETPLDFNAVFSLAAQFITGFAADSPPLPFKAFPGLTLQPSEDPYVAGSSSVTFENAFANAANAGLVTQDSKVFAVFFSGQDIYYVPATMDEANYKVDMIPGADFAAPGQLPPSGQVYVVLSTADGSAGNEVSDGNTLSGVGILEVLVY